MLRACWDSGTPWGIEIDLSCTFSFLPSAPSPTIASPSTLNITSPSTLNITLLLTFANNTFASSVTSSRFSFLLSFFALLPAVFSFSVFSILEVPNIPFKPIPPAKNPSTVANLARSLYGAYGKAYIWSMAKNLESINQTNE
jgi:hypothetical protein